MRRLASVVLTGALLTACGDSFSPEGVSGLYNLESINGNPVPFSETETRFGETVTVTVSAGSVSLNANSTYSISVTTQFESAGTSRTDTDTDSGTFELVEPATVRFKQQGGDGDTFAATLDGNRLTFIDNGDSFVFEK